MVNSMMQDPIVANIATALFRRGNRSETVVFASRELVPELV